MSPTHPRRRPEPAAEVRHYGDPDLGGPLIRLRTTTTEQHLEVFRHGVGWESAPERMRDILNGNVHEIDAATAERIRAARGRRPRPLPSSGDGP